MPGSRHAASDALYAARLLDMLDADRRRLHDNPAHASIVLWMVEETRAAAEALKVDRETSRRMSLEAARARQAAIEARRRERRKRKSRAA